MTNSNTACNTKAVMYKSLLMA